MRTHGHCDELLRVAYHTALTQVELCAEFAHQKAARNSKEIKSSGTYNCLTVPTTASYSDDYVSSFFSSCKTTTQVPKVYSSGAESLVEELMEK